MHTETILMPRAGARETRSDTVWLAHLHLLAGLPYAPMTLAPALLDALLSGFDADFAVFNWHGNTGDAEAPRAIYVQRMTAPVLEWIMRHHSSMNAMAPFEEQLRTDGENMRELVRDPAFLHSAVFRNSIEPLNGRWIMGVPLLSREGACLGFVYLHRGPERGPFSDAEQQRLQRARDRLWSLGSQPAGWPKKLPRLAVRSALLHFDPRGHLRSCSAAAYDLLFACRGGRVGNLAWTAGDISALPEPMGAQVRAMLRSSSTPSSVVQSLEQADGAMLELRAERLLTQGGDPEVLVVISQLEPADLAVARQLRDWPLTPREKQLVVASTRELSHRELAAEMGCTVGTLNGYVNALHAKLGVDSRDELLNLLLERARQGQH